LIQTETGATVARRRFYMFSIIYHAGAAVLFLVMSLAGGPGRRPQNKEKNKLKLIKIKALWLVLTNVLLLAVSNPKKNT
ncbi:hypothetical protein ACVGXE_00110, partial [Escherichia coli]